jgi:glycosyltransferase involved in cell wall biosynthesis
MRLLILLGGQVFSGAEITTLRFAAALPAGWSIEVAAHPAVANRAATFGLPVHPWANESAPGDTLLRASHFIDEPNPASQPARTALQQLIEQVSPDTVMACMFPVAMLALPVLQQHRIRLFVHHQLMYNDLPDHPITVPVRRVADYADGIIAASHAVNEPLKRSGILNVRVIPAGLPTGYGKVKDQTPERLRILSIGTWGPQKGLETLLEADRLLRAQHLEYDLTIAGPLHAYSTDYETAVRTLAHPSVRFIGHQPDPAPCYENADLLIVPSSDPDPYPTVTLEGMAHSLAVIATDCGGLGEQVVDGITGFLVPPRNCSAMAEAMKKIVISGQAERMGNAGRQRVRTIADINQQAAALAQLIRASAP